MITYKRTFYNRSVPFLKTLWNSLLQPHLDYACLLWSPIGEICEVKRMESILRAFTKKCKGLRNLPYHERLKKIGLMQTVKLIQTSKTNKHVFYRRFLTNKNNLKRSKDLSRVMDQALASLFSIFNPNGLLLPAWWTKCDRLLPMFRPIAIF